MQCLTVKEYTSLINAMQFPMDVPKEFKYKYKGESINDLEECIGKYNFWNYPIDEIEHVDEMGKPFVIVRCTDGYRICEM